MMDPEKDFWSSHLTAENKRQSGPDSLIGKLGMCLGRQLCKAGTPHKKKKNKKENWKNPLYLFTSFIILWQCRLFWYQNEGISFPFTLYSQLCYIIKSRRAFCQMLRERGYSTSLSLWLKLHKTFMRAMRLCRAKENGILLPHLNGWYGTAGRRTDRGWGGIRPVPWGGTHLKSRPADNTKTNGSIGYANDKTVVSSQQAIAGHPGQTTWWIFKKRNIVV